VNKEVINTNSRRFRYSLLSLLLGILWLSYSGILFIGDSAERGRIFTTVPVVLLTVLLAWYILTGRYLTLDDVP